MGQFRNSRRISCTDLPRRRFLRLAAGATGLVAVPPKAWAQSYPTRPIRIVVGFAAGGLSDILARLLGQWLTERLGQQFVVENRAGAASNLATELVVRAPSDGYTLLIFNSSAAINQTLYDKLSFTFTRDISPIAAIMSVPDVMVVNPSVPARTVPEFIAYARANPRSLSMGSGGIGSPSHIYGELFKTLARVDLIHVPYRGGAPALTGLLGGYVQVVLGAVPESIEYIRAGQVRPLAVTTRAPLDALPGIPPLSDFLPGYEASGWQGIGAPKNTPAGIIDKLNQEINSALADAKIKARLAALGGTALVMSPDDFAKFIADETEKWAMVVRAAKLKVE
jgi:tripartite-type tricarboxylate transporter receptor subunit TctC